MRLICDFRPGALLCVFTGPPRNRCNLTKSRQVLSQPPLKVEIVGTLGIRLLFFLVPSLLFLVFDSILPSLSVGLKTQGAAALPTRTGGVQGGRRGGSRPQWYQVIGVSLLNILLSVVIQAGVELLFTQVFHIRSALKVTTTLPMPWSIAKDVLRGLLLREVFKSVQALAVINQRRSSNIMCTASSSTKILIS
jgi:hypothetical protein